MEKDPSDNTSIKSVLENRVCERRDSNPHTEVLVPKTSVYTNFTTLAKEIK